MRSSAEKIVPMDGLTAAISRLTADARSEGRTEARTEARTGASSEAHTAGRVPVIVTTNGCFDILHIGHISLLERARELGDILVVGVNSDRSVRALKGEGRPFVTDQERAAVVAALESVDLVTIFDDDLPLSFIQAAAPQIHVKGGDYTEAEMPEAELVRSLGGRVEILALHEAQGGVRSSSGIAREAARRGGPK